MIEVWYLDESGFAPTLPNGYTWARSGVRPVVREEAPQGRRLNVLGALAAGGAAPGLAWTAPPGKLDSEVFAEFVGRQVAKLPVPLPADYRRDRPCVIVLDNYAVHRSKPVQALLPVWERAGVYCYYLPAYSPELNRIEEVWRHLKYEELPQRSYRTLTDLRAAVTEALAKHALPLPTPLHPPTDLPEAA